ncbi:6-phospho-3-hexuloisomerase [Cryobacterium tagatosivorans]|uniref:6-phospho-3-hexuloisomerase n=1 Tax=Cryobacterium tagatosivorans TaxID=1259199 RepID=A0A4R8UIU8_9MICO|nr:6-phospho-3-hexuloisomerase [Cryobacterium tagatosivorans]TFB54429.1 6-phospho-3-hexuloisomerase [Cryobacterium tagatosivorans]
MHEITSTLTGPTVAESLATIAAEQARVIRRLIDGPNTTPDAEFEAAVARLQTARRIFVMGAGRSGLALRMTAMRLMHLGLDVHVVGEVTTPAIAASDVLLVASGSGMTRAVVGAAETAGQVGAAIVTITTTPGSRLAELSSTTIVLPAAQKEDHAGTISAQYSGSLFEQLVLTVGDAIFHTLWQASGATAEQLWPRHANLE